MKIEDTNHDQDLDEASPMSALKRAGSKLKTMVPFAKQWQATGKAQLQTGKLANQIMVDYKAYLGATGKPSTADTLLYFLSRKGYPTTNAKQELSAQAPQPATAASASTTSAQPATSASTRLDPALESKFTSAERMRNLLQLLEAAVGEISDDMVSKAIMASAQEYTDSGYFGDQAAPQQSSQQPVQAVSPQARPVASQPAASVSQPTAQTATTPSSTEPEDASEPQVTPMSTEQAVASLQKVWNSWVESGKNESPEMRKLIKQMWLDSGGTTATESRKNTKKKRV